MPDMAKMFKKLDLNKGEMVKIAYIKECKRVKNGMKRTYFEKQHIDKK